MRRKFDAMCRQYQVKDTTNLLDLNGSDYGYITAYGTVSNNGKQNRHTKHLNMEPGVTYAVRVNQKIMNIGIAIFDVGQMVLQRYDNNNTKEVILTAPICRREFLAPRI